MITKRCYNYDYHYRGDGGRGREGGGLEPRNGAPQGGASKGRLWVTEGWAAKPAGVSHDSLRAQTCTFEGPGLQKHHQDSTRRPLREIVVGKGKSVVWEGGSGPGEWGPKEGGGRGGGRDALRPKFSG